MDIATLRTFIVIAEVGSFTEAAEQLYLTQSAVSKRIAGLESVLNTQLFDRIGKQASLTEAGRRFIATAREVVHTFENGQREIEALSQIAHGSLSLGTSHHLGLHRLPLILKRYVKEFPDVELNLQFMGSEEVCAQVLKNKLDLGIVTLPVQPLPLLESQVLWHDNMLVVVGKSHPFYIESKRASQRLTLAALSESAAILPTAATHTRKLIDEKFQKTNLSLNTTMETNNLETIRMLVSVGLGWSILPELMLRSGLVKVSMGKLKIQRKLGVVWHEKRMLSVAAQRMIERLQD